MLKCIHLMWLRANKQVCEPVHSTVRCFFFIIFWVPWCQEHVAEASERQKPGCQQQHALQQPRHSLMEHVITSRWQTGRNVSVSERVRERAREGGWRRIELSLHNGWSNLLVSRNRRDSCDAERQGNVSVWERRKKSSIAEGLYSQCLPPTPAATKWSCKKAVVRKTKPSQDFLSIN